MCQGHSVLRNPQSLALFSLRDQYGHYRRMRKINPLKKTTHGSLCFFPKHTLVATGINRHAQISGREGVIGRSCADAFWDSCIFPIFPEGGAPAGSVWPGSGSEQPDPGHWHSWLLCQPAESQGLPSRVRFFSITIPPLAEIWILGKMRKKGREGKRERLSSKRNRLTKPGLGGFAERPVSCQMGQAWGWGPGWTRCLH